MAKCIGLAHIGVFVEDFERSVKFYTEVLDFKVNWKGGLDDKDGHFDIALVQNDAVILEIVRQPDSLRRQRKEDGPIDHIAILYDDVSEMHQKLLKMGYEFETQELVENPEFGGTGAKWIFFRGPDGEHIELAQLLK